MATKKKGPTVATAKKNRKAKAPEGKSKTVAMLDEILGGPMTLGESLAIMRDLAGLNQTQAAKLLGVSCSRLCNVEKGRSVITPEKAYQWAVALEHPPTVFVQLALQAQIDRMGMSCTVSLSAA